MSLLDEVYGRPVYRFVYMDMERCQNYDCEKLKQLCVKCNPTCIKNSNMCAWDYVYRTLLKFCNNYFKEKIIEGGCDKEGFLNFISVHLVLLQLA